MYPVIRKVYIENYKSIARSYVELDDFTVLVGINGSGKSNFLDALAFVKQAVSESLDSAFSDRSGIPSVICQSIDEADSFGIRLLIELEKNTYADYAFEIQKKGEFWRFSVLREKCVVSQNNNIIADYEIKDGLFTKTIKGIKPKLSSEKLSLYAVSDIDEFRPLYDFLSTMLFYSIDPSSMKEIQKPDVDQYLKRDGNNIASILEGIDQEFIDRRITSLMAKVSPEINKIGYVGLPEKEGTLIFNQDTGEGKSFVLLAKNMSDGTLRTLGLLVALYQSESSSFLAIEEPEATIHPGALEIIIQTLLEASVKRQVLITTHSPDLIDFKDIKDANIRLVTREFGKTVISNLSETNKETIKSGLYSVGELHRMDELSADYEVAVKSSENCGLFETGF
jgi:predicted ATPase